MIRWMRMVVLLSLAAVLCFAAGARAQDIMADDNATDEDVIAVDKVTVSDNATATGGRTIHISIGDVVSLTLRNNLTVTTSYLDRVLNKFQLEQANTKFQPNVNLDGTASMEAIRKNRAVSGHSKTGSESKQDAEIKATVEQKIPTGATLSFGWENNYANDASTSLLYDPTAGDVSRTNSRTDGASSSLSILLTQPLLKDAGIDYNTASIKLAQIQEEQNILTLRDSLSALINDGANYFFAFVRAMESLKIQKQALERSQRLLEINKLKMSLGRMSRSDVTQAEADVASQELSLEESRNSYDQARRNLLNHLNLDPNLQIDPIMDGYRKLHPKLDECMAVALKRNKSYLDSVFAVNKAEINYMMAENQRKWDLSIKAGAGTTKGKDNPGRSYTDTETRVGLDLKAKINLWGDDYMSREYTLLEVAKARRKARVELQKARIDLQTQVANTVRNVNMRLKFIELAKRNTALQREQLENENIKLMAGRSTNFQVVSYQSQLVTAQQSEISSILSYLQALLELDQMLGTTMKTWNVKFKTEDTKLEKELSDEVRPLVWSWW